MSVLGSDFLARAVPQGMGRLGESVTLSCDGQADVELKALVGAEDIEIEDRPNGRTQRRVRIVTVSADAAGEFGGVETLKRNPRMTIDGREWAVEDQQRGPAGVVRLRVVRAETEDRGRPGMRARVNQ